MEVEFQLPAAAAVEDHIDPRVDVVVGDLLEGGHVGVPLRGVVAEEVVRHARELVLRRDDRIGVPALELQLLGHSHGCLLPVCPC
jgi:hypothetical protein